MKRWLIKWIWPGTGFFCFEIGKYAGRYNVPWYIEIALLTIACGIWRCGIRVDLKSFAALGQEP